MTSNFEELRKRVESLPIRHVVESLGFRTRMVTSSEFEIAYQPEPGAKAEWKSAYKGNVKKNSVFDHKRRYPSGTPYWFLVGHFANEWGWEVKKGADGKTKYPEGFWKAFSEYAETIAADVVASGGKFTEFAEVEEERYENNVEVIYMATDLVRNHAGKYAVTEEILKKLSERAISKASVDFYDVRFGDVSGTGERPRLLFVMRDGDGGYVGVKQRDLYAKDAKFKSMQVKGSHAGLLFNRQDVETSPLLVFVEGEMDALALVSAWARGIVGNLSGAGTSRDDWKKLVAGKAVVISYDGDDAGKIGTKGIGERLLDAAKGVFVMNDWDGEKDPNDWTKKLVKEKRFWDAKTLLAGKLSKSEPFQKWVARNFDSEGRLKAPKTK